MKEANEIKCVDIIRDMAWDDADVIVATCVRIATDEYDCISIQHRMAEVYRDMCIDEDDIVTAAVCMMWEVARRGGNPREATFVD